MFLFQLASKQHPVHTGRPHKDIAEIEQFAGKLLEEDTEKANSSESCFFEHFL